MTGSLEIILRILSNTGFEESSLKFIYNFLHFFAAEAIHIIEKIETAKKTFFFHLSLFFVSKIY